MKTTSKKNKISKEFPNCAKRQRFQNDNEDSLSNNVGSTINIQDVIHLGIPHVGEQIFESIETDDLIQFLSISKSWKVIAENVLFKKWKSELFKACHEGKSDIVRILLERLESEEIVTSLNKFFKGRGRNRKKKTAFISACENGHQEGVKLLLAHEGIEKVDLNATLNRGSNAFMLASENGHKGVVQILLDHSSCNRIDTNAQCANYGMTALTLACSNGHEEVVKLLLDADSRRKIDVNARDHAGRTAFFWACRFGHKKVAKLLLETSKHDVEIIAEDYNSKHVGFYPGASKNKTWEVIRLLENHPIYRKKLRYQNEFRMV